MNTLQYRCYLYDPEVPRPERPIQAFFTSKMQAERWANEVLRKASNNSEVWIYKIEELLEGSWKKKVS